MTVGLTHLPTAHGSIDVGQNLSSTFDQGPLNDRDTINEFPKQLFLTGDLGGQFRTGTRLPGLPLLAQRCNLRLHPAEIPHQLLKGVEIRGRLGGGPFREPLDNGERTTVLFTHRSQTRHQRPFSLLN